VAISAAQIEADSSGSRELVLERRGQVGPGGLNGRGDAAK